MEVSCRRPAIALSCLFFFFFAVVGVGEDRHTVCGGKGQDRQLRRRHETRRERRSAHPCIDRKTTDKQEKETHAPQSEQEIDTNTTHEDLLFVIVCKHDVEEVLKQLLTTTMRRRMRIIHIWFQERTASPIPDSRTDSHLMTTERQMITV